MKTAANPPGGQTPNETHRGAQLISVESQREYDLLSGDWEERTFVKLYIEARRSGLLAAISDRDWKTLCTLATYMDGNGYCYPSQAELARALGCSRQMANERVRSLASFRFAGRSVLLVVKGERSRHGQWTRNGYRVLPLSSLRIFDQPSSPSPAAGSGSTRAQSMSRKVDTGTAPSASSQTVTVEVDINKTDLSKQDFNLRTSKAHAGKITTRSSELDGAAPPQHQTTHYPISPHRSTSAAASPGSFVPLVDTLNRLHPQLRASADNRSTPRTQLKPKPSDRLLASVTEIAHDLGDSRHLRSNVTQAQHLLEQSGIEEAAFITRLYEARAVTRDRARSGTRAGTVSKPMAYFWRVVRDQLGLPVEGTEATVVSAAAELARRQGRGEERTNGQRDG